MAQRVMLKIGGDPIPGANKTAPLPLYVPKDVVKSIRVEDIRKNNPTTGLPLRDTERKTIDADPELIKNIVAHAKSRKIDPLTALAISYQETGLNKDAPYNLNPMVFGKPTGNPEEGIKTIEDQLAYAKAMQARKVIPEGEDYLLQGYNGYGKINRGHADLEGASRIYGFPIPDQGIDFKNNPLYGKTVISLRDLLKSNPQIAEIIQNTPAAQLNKKLMLKIKK